MQSSFNRRRFLSTSTAALAVSAIYRGNTAAAAPVQPKTDDADATGVAPLFDISLAQWSLHRKLKSGKMDNLDFAKVAKEDFGIHGIEYVNQFFADKAEDQGYLGEMKQRAADLGVKSLLIMIDREGQLGDPDDAKRAKAVEKHHKWVEAAKFLGCHSIRVNAASGGSYEEQVGRAADGLAKLSV